MAVCQPENRLIAFTSAGQGFALPIEYVREVLIAGDIEPVPESREFFEGLMVYRKEQVLPVLSLPTALGEKGKNWKNSGNLILVTEMGGKFFGFRVDRIGGAIRYPSDEAMEKYQGEYSGVEGAVVGQILEGGKELLILNPEKFFGSFAD